MTTTTSTATLTLETTDGGEQHEKRQKSSGRLLNQSITDIIDLDANDSGNELSMGGSSSEGDSSSHHRGEHSPNQHHHHHLYHQESLLGVPRGSSNSTSTVFQPFGGGGSSLFDTPQSMLSSPAALAAAQAQTAMSPSGFGTIDMRSELFRCAVCQKCERMGGVLQFVCAHKTCQSCFQSPPFNAPFDLPRHHCSLCGAGTATAANFPPQMFLSPTLTTPPHAPGLLLDATSSSIGSATSSSSNQKTSTPRAFSFSLSGLPGTPSPIQMPRLSMDTWSPMGSSVAATTPSAGPSPLTIRNLPSLGAQQKSPMMQSAFDSLAVPRTSMCWTPRHPTMSSSSSMTPVPCNGQVFTMPSPSPLQNPPVNGPVPPIPCQGCEGNGAFAFCMQCQEALCAHCVQAHQRVRATKQHAFIELNQLVATLMSRMQHQQQAAQMMHQQQQQNGPSSSSSSSLPPVQFLGSTGRPTLGSVGSGDGHGMDDSTTASGESSPRSSSVCGQHESPIVGFCEHCPQSSLCAICVAQHPGQHRVQPIGDVRMAVGELTNESQVLQWQCEKTGETIQRLIDGIVNNASTAENEIRTAFDTHVNALEERRKELLKRVEAVKSLKLSVLITQAEHLKSKQLDLQNAIQLAKHQMDTDSDDASSLRQIFDQLIACQMCSTEPNNNMLNVLMLACQLNEDDRLKFTAPQDGILLNKARQFGSIESGPCAKTSSIVGDNFKKAIRERQTVIYVQLRDACGDLLSSSIAATQPTAQALLPHQAPHAHLEQAMPTADVQAFVICPNGTPVDVSMTPRENGIVAVSYFPATEGSYTLNILVKGSPIQGCPTTMEVRRGRNYDEIAAKGPILTFGKEGSGDGELCRPWGICVDQLGRVIVADRSNNRSLSGPFGAPAFSSTPTPLTPSPRQLLDRPTDLAVGPDGRIYVVDFGNNCIRVF
ncbi:Protein CBR-LIN-41 [Caenorhabditis briggsae]|uniref:Protein CBR-LIN-41 n=1 Tax=Caenorhabditis briggsae TaxID=6238 RepID=A8Y1D1_CAEBR|nr:Protein CBR-LIN-41 [Caenorhabditis briggsae]CAP38700.2 Protein CBR-LIN-41 [Caenorhabditis briggsae]